MEIILNGENMKDEKSTHEYLKRKFQFPDYYGENLDALWDLLNEIDEDIHIKIIKSWDIYNNLDRYGDSLMQLFIDLEEEKKNIKLEID